MKRRKQRKKIRNYTKTMELIQKSINLVIHLTELKTLELHDKCLNCKHSFEPKFNTGGVVGVGDKENLMPPGMIGTIAPNS